MAECKKSNKQEKYFAGKIIIAVLTMVCLFMLLGCEQNSGSEAKGEVEISTDTGVVYEAAAEKTGDDMQSAKSFEELYPNVNIVNSGWSFSPESYLAKAEGNTLPTLYYVPMTEAYNIIEQGYALDITDEYIKREYYEYTRDFILENISRDGRVYMIPTSIYDLGLFVNMDVYRETGYVSEDDTPYQPKTWEETAEIAKKIKETTGNAGFVFPTNGRVAGWLFMPIAWSYGTVFEKYEDGEWKASFNSPECTAALQYVKDLKWKYGVLQNEQLTDEVEYRVFIAKNKCGFAFSDGIAVRNMITAGMNRDIVGLVSMPAGPVRKVTLVGGGYHVINKNAAPEQKKAALDWIEYDKRPVRLTEVYKKRVEESLKKDDEAGYLIGIESIDLWEKNAEAAKYLKQKTKQETNVNYNHIRQYNDKSTVEFKLEEPIEAQMLYEILGKVINKVLTDENSNPGELLEAAEKEFQEKYLDYIN